MKGLKICATGRCLPDRVFTNEDMTKIIDTTDEWITSRTGVKERRYIEEGQSNTDLAEAAARAAIAKAGISLDQLCCCVVATVTPDLLAPTIGCMLQMRMGLPQDIPCFEMNVGCSGFVYGLQVVRGLLAQSDRPYALLIGSDTLSRITDYTDRSTCILFADGAGAVVLTLDDTYRYESILCAKGDPETILIDGPNHPKPVIHMKGQDTFRFATEVLTSSVHHLLERSGLTLDDVSWVVPHQANYRIIKHAAKHLGMSMDRFYVNIDRYGNTSAASIPIALDEMDEKGLLQRGQTIVFVAFGAGLTWGGTLMQW